MAIYFAMPGNERLARDLAEMTAGDLGGMEVRRFPDGETYVRVLSDVRGKEVFIVCTLDDPDRKFLPLAFAASTVSEFGAARVELIAPYLAYMRQDRIFHSGEALSSRLFAEMLGQHFDALLTVDPHLHRCASLDEVYDIPSRVVHAAPLLAQWVANNVEQGFLVGPDAESAQWVEAIARDADVPWTVFSKDRRSNGTVWVTPPDLREMRGRVPILVDDILSSGATIRQAIRILREQNFPPAYCLIVHALCSERTARVIRDVSNVLLTSDSVPNPDAAFELAGPIAEALQRAAASACTKPRERVGQAAQMVSKPPRPSRSRRSAGSARQRAR